MESFMINDFNELRAAGITFFGGDGGWVYDEWQHHNEMYFGGKLTPGGIIWALTPRGHAMGYYHPKSNRITLHPSTLHPKRAGYMDETWMKSELMGKKYASDLLLHEMIHQSLYQLRGWTGPKVLSESSHNNKFWCEEIVRIAPKIGLKPILAQPIKQRRVDGIRTRDPKPGHLSRDELSCFPHCLRYDEYYRDG